MLEDDAVLLGHGNGAQRVSRVCDVGVAAAVPMEATTVEATMMDTEDGRGQG